MCCGGSFDFREREMKVLRVGRYPDSWRGPSSSRRPVDMGNLGSGSQAPWHLGSFSVTLLDRRLPRVGVSAFHAAAAVLCITLAACATTKPEPQIVTKEVQIPVMVKCHPDIGPEPDYPDTDAKLKAAPDLFSKVQLLVAGRIMRMSRDAVKSAALSACEG